MWIRFICTYSAYARYLPHRLCVWLPFFTLFFSFGHAPLAVIFFKCTAFPSSIGSLPPHSHVNSSVSLAHAHFRWTRCIGLSPIVQCTWTFIVRSTVYMQLTTGPNMLASRLSKKPKIYWPHDKNGIAVKLSNRHVWQRTGARATTHQIAHLPGEKSLETREW